MKSMLPAACERRVVQLQALPSATELFNIIKWWCSTFFWIAYQFFIKDIFIWKIILGLIKKIDITQAASFDPLFSQSNRIKICFRKHLQLLGQSGVVNYPNNIRSLYFLQYIDICLLYLCVKRIFRDNTHWANLIVTVQYA